MKKKNKNKKRDVDAVETAQKVEEVEAVEAVDAVQEVEAVDAMAAAQINGEEILELVTSAFEGLFHLIVMFFAGR